MTINGWSSSTAKSKICTMLGWRRDAISLASRRKRAHKALVGGQMGENDLDGHVAIQDGSCARWTSAMPPRPRLRVTIYLPKACVVMIKSDQLDRITDNRRHGLAAENRRALCDGHQLGVGAQAFAVGMGVEGGQLVRVTGVKGAQLWVATASD